MQTMIKEARELGNGAHVLVPRGWIDRKVIVTLKERDVREEVLEMIKPQLEHIKGVYLYGSYARNEEDPDSDVDILIIADKKITVEKEGYEIVVVTEKDIEKTLKNNAALILPIIRECSPIINQELIGAYQKKRLTRGNTGWYIDTTASSLSIAKKLIKEGDLQGMPNIVYPIMMRARGLFLIKKLINNQKYSNKEFLALLAKGLKKDKIKQLYRMYRENRDKKRISSHSLDYSDVEKLYHIADNLLKEVTSVWERLK